MAAYIVKRLLALVPILVVVGTISFLIIHFIPGNPASTILGADATDQQMERLERQLGLHDPIYVQFSRWFLSAIQGDFGQSIFLGRPVTQAIVERLEPTLLLAIAAQILSVLVGVPAGIVAGLRRGSLWDTVIMSLSVLGFSIPNFWLGIVLILTLSVGLGWFPVAGYAPLSTGWLRTAHTLALPTFVLGITLAAMVARMTRSSVLEILRQDYIRTAKAKGISEYLVIGRHVLKNALIPVITTVGILFGTLLSGTIVVETVFTIPGLGQLVRDAVLRRDYPVIQGVLVFAALAYVLVNLLVDLIYLLLDPRIKY